MTARALLPRLMLGAVLAGAAILLLVHRESLDASLIHAMAVRLGAWASVAYVGVFATATLLFVPGALFGLAGGAIFGPVLGAALNLAGGTLGATAAFLVARYLAGDRVGRWAGPRLEELVSGVEAEGWRFVALVRLVPVFPFNLSNYAFGLTRIPLGQCVVPSLVCMIPGTIAFTWLGHAGREAAAGDETALRYALLGLGLLAAVAFLPRLLRIARGRKPLSWIDVEELAGHRAGDGTTLVDVRTPEEFAGPLGHIGGAINLPVGELDERLTEFDALRESRIVVVCRTDKRSAAAASRLRLAGFSNVRVLRGGMELSNSNGLPVDGRPSHEHGVS